MRLLPIALIPFVTGCFFGDAAVPIVCSTDLTGTQYSICLHGPHEIGYFYTIETPDGDCGLRELGKISIDESIPPKLEELGDEVFRVTWGTPPHTAFTTIDTTLKLVVADSNESNPAKTEFETPRYLRPEYARLRELAEQAE
jgi:hypothetical protein